MGEGCTLCPITDTTITATTSLRPTIPDRQAFQQALREYNQSITETVAKIDRIIGKNNNVGTLSMLKQSKQEPCRRREQLKLEADEMKIEINEIKRLLAEKNALLSDIENDLVYRDESRLTARLEELEVAYSQAKFTSSRTEKALVKEIDKLKLNRAKLTQTVLKSIREITNQLDITDRHIRQQRRDFSQLKKSLCDLHARKKKLVNSYNEKRKEYIDWSNRNKNLYPATYPSAHRHQSSANFIDEETLEPFYEQKMACKRLIEYLTSLQSQMLTEYPSLVSDAKDETCRQIAAEGSEDSAEEYPSSFSALTIHPLVPVCTAVEQESKKEASLIHTLKKKNCKKSLKKPCQKISHPLQMLCFFKETEIAVPQTYREIKQTLNMVRILLKQYQEQTNVIVWEEGDYQQLPSLSESEHTAESTWNGSTDTSDRGSVFNFHTCSSLEHITPAQERSESFATDPFSDEGFESKNSTH